MTAPDAPAGSTARRGGDHWYHARPDCLCFKVACVVHRLGQARARTVADACQLTPKRAYEALIACERQAHLYHLRRISPGLFAAIA